MIRIPCKQREKMTFHDYDILMSVNVYRKKLKDGESVNSIMLNARILFWEDGRIVGIWPFFVGASEPELYKNLKFSPQ